MHHKILRDYQKLKRFIFYFFPNSWRNNIKSLNFGQLQSFEKGSTCMKYGQIPILYIYKYPCKEDQNFGVHFTIFPTLLYILYKIIEKKKIIKICWGQCGKKEEKKSWLNKK